MILRWLLSSTVRQAADLNHRVKKMLCAQWDILPPQARDAIQQAMTELRGTITSGGEKKAILERAANVETAANKWLKPYPNASMRENVDVILVALVVAMGVRTFFVQPMAIPTGSMQPTLFGIMPSEPTYEPELKIPSLPVRIFDSVFRGVSYYHFVAQEDGRFELVDEEPKSVFPLVKRQRFKVGAHEYSVWFPPERFFHRARLHPFYKKGEDILKLKITSGDRLFVDRVTYNFRRPERGEIIIFETNGIDGLEQGTHYIKRLVGLGGEKIRIGDDRHMAVNGVRLDASTPHFENVYGFDPKTPPQQDNYSGHVNETVAIQNRRPGLSPLFPDAKAEFTIAPIHYLVFGDNTMNSKDSRSWGDFPREKVVGKCSFVFWPITSRFGWGVR